MLLSPLRIRVGVRRGGVALAAVLLAGPAGCGVFRPSTAPEPVSPPQTEVHRAADPGPLIVASPPGQHATRRGHYVFYHDFDLNEADSLFAELEALPDEVFGELGLPPSTGIVQVFLFDTQERYERFMKARYPSLPTRRAYMIDETTRQGNGPPELKVFTWMGDHLRTDLRHELTHALLHGVLKNVPLWLDEGLAGFFELPPGNDGVNPQHLELIRRGPFKPDLVRLEKLEQVGQMQKPEYREAWAWVHLMLRSTPAAKAVLRDYLQTLRTTDKPGLLLPKLRDTLPDPDEALFEHLAGVPLPRHRAASPR